MTIYWIGCFLSYAFAVISYKFRKKRQITYEKRTKSYDFINALIVSLPLIFIASIRYNVGMDYPAYRSLYIQIANGITVEQFEYLYHLLNQIIAYFGGEYPWIFSITAIIFMTIVTMQVFKDSPYPALSVFLLLSTTYYFCFLNGIRSMLAYAICLYSIRYIENRQFIKFLITILIAGGFHTTGYIFIAVYFLYNMKLSNLTAFACSAIVAFCAPLLGKLINYLMLSTKYFKFLESSYMDKEQGYVTLMINILILIFCSLFYDKENKKEQLYFKLQIVAVWTSFLVPYVPLIGRIRWMFGLPVIILIPMSLKNITDIRLRTLVYTAIMVLYAIYMYISVAINNTNNVLPYETIFSHGF